MNQTMLIRKKLVGARPYFIVQDQLLGPSAVSRYSQLSILKGAKCISGSILKKTEFFSFVFLTQNYAEENSKQVEQQVFENN